MKSLQIIQTISKIGKVISTIVFVCCIVGFCMCIVGLVTTALGMTAVKLGGVTLQSILQNEAQMTEGTLYLSLIAGAILCAGQAVLAKFAAHYFERELRDGTPFTSDGAKELLRLGVLSICIPVAVQIASMIAEKIITRLFAGVESPDMDPAVSLTVGALVIILALVCRYGAELAAQRATSDPAPEQEQ